MDPTLLPLLRRAVCIWLPGKEGLLWVGSWKALLGQHDGNTAHMLGSTQGGGRPHVSTALVRSKVGPRWLMPDWMPWAL